jgi:hypothetical protein
MAASPRRALLPAAILLLALLAAVSVNATGNRKNKPDTNISIVTKVVTEAGLPLPTKATVFGPSDQVWVGRPRGVAVAVARQQRCTEVIVNGPTHLQTEPAYPQSYIVK